MYDSLLHFILGECCSEASLPSFPYTAFSLGPGLTEVTVFGGTAEPLTGSDEIQPKLADTTLLQFSELLNVYTSTITCILCSSSILECCTA